MAGELTKGYIGKEDLKLQTNTDDAETFERVTSVGGSATITKVPDIWGGTGKINVAEVQIAGSELLEKIIADYLKGYIRGLEVSYKDADEIYVSAGMIHINDGTDDVILYCDSQLTKLLSGLGTTEMRYIYVDRPASGSTIVAADIEHNTTAPTYSHSKKGWYHPTTTDLRFIGSICIDGSGHVVKGYRSRGGNGWTYDAYQTLDADETGTTWTDIPNIANFTPAIDNAKITLMADIDSTDNGNAKALYIRKNGSSATNGTLIAYVMGTTAGNYMWVITEYPVDSSGKIEYKIGPNNTNTTARFYSQGYWEPR